MSSRGLDSKRWLIALVMLLVPAVGSAQVSNPTDFSSNPHPGMPWSGITNPNSVDYGSVLRYISVAPQSVVIEVPAPVPDGLPRENVQQLVEIPGYQIVETTTGFYYPERWTLDQLNVGVYQWRRLQAEFRRKP
jgi:hypothetical protein